MDNLASLTNNSVSWVYKNRQWIFGGIGILILLWIKNIILKFLRFFWSCINSSFKKIKILILEKIIRGKKWHYSHIYFWHDKKITIKAAPLPDHNHYSLKYSVSGSKKNAKLYTDIMGFAFKIYDIDLDGDGQNEVIITYHCGGHSRGICIFKFDGQLLLPIHPQNMGSDWPEILWKDEDHDGKYEIYCKQHEYDNFNVCINQKFTLNEQAQYQLSKEWASEV